MSNNTKITSLIHPHASVSKHSRIKKGTVVAVEGDFSPNSIALLLSLIEKACIVVPINNSTNLNRKKLYKISQVEHVFSISNNDEITSTKISDQSNNELYKIIRSRRNPGLVLFTSGTSGEPKAAVHDFLVLLEKFKIKGNYNRY